MPPSLALAARRVAIGAGTQAAIDPQMSILTHLIPEILKPLLELANKNIQEKLNKTLSGCRL